EAEWRAEGASGVFSPKGYLIAAPFTVTNVTWMRAGIAGQAIEGDREAMRDLYAAAAERWVDEGHARHAAFVPSHDAELVDAWFRLTFGDSAMLALRETGPEEPFDAGIEIRPGGEDDFDEAARLELAMGEAMEPSPSFSDLELQTQEEIAAEWHEEGLADKYELFVGERDRRIGRHLLL